MCEAESLDDLFVIPISHVAAAELEELQVLLLQFDLSDAHDQRSFCWGNSKYAAAKVYKLAFISNPTHNVLKLVWKSKVTPRVKFFAWLILMDRLNTKEMLERRHFHVQPNCLCILCSRRESESIEHLFFECDFAVSCWNRLGIIWAPEDNFTRRFEQTRDQAGLPFFMEIFLLAAWELWKVQNRQVFDGVQATFDSWLFNFKTEARLQAHRFHEDKRLIFNLWLDNL